MSSTQQDTEDEELSHDGEDDGGIPPKGELQSFDESSGEELLGLGAGETSDISPNLLILPPSASHPERSQPTTCSSCGCSGRVPSASSFLPSPLLPQPYSVNTTFPSSSSSSSSSAPVPPLQWCPGAKEEVLCVTCSFRSMDPFRPVASPEHVLHVECLHDVRSAFTLEMPELRAWRKQGLEIEARMLRRGASKDVSGKTRHPLHQVWPRFLTMEINGHQVITIKAGPRGKKRRDLPQCISANFRRGSNDCFVYVEDDDRREFWLGIVLVSPLKPRDLAKGIPAGSSETDLGRVRGLLSRLPSVGHSEGSTATAASESDLRGSALDGVECVGDERLTLSCPISLVRPCGPPVRGAVCKHLRCMDVEAYLVSNYRMKAFNSRWRCPICNLELRPQDLYIDSFVQDVLTQTGEEVEEVMVEASGEWRIAKVASPAEPSPEHEDGDPPGVPAPAPILVGARAAGILGTCVVPDDEEGEGADPSSQAAGPPVVLGCAPPSEADLQQMRRRSARLAEQQQQQQQLRQQQQQQQRQRQARPPAPAGGPGAAKRAWASANPIGGTRKVKDKKLKDKRTSNQNLAPHNGLPLPPLAPATMPRQLVPPRNPAAVASALMQSNEALSGKRPRLGQSQGLQQQQFAVGARRSIAPSKGRGRGRGRGRAAVPPPKHAIDVDSDAEPEVVSDSDNEASSAAPPIFGPPPKGGRA